MKKKISKNTAFVATAGAIVAVSSLSSMDANAVQIGINDGVPEGFTDANGNLCGYYTEDGKWVGNKLRWQWSYPESITVKIYKVSDTVDTTQKDTYTFNKNTVDSKWCVQDANNRRIIPDAVLVAKNSDGNIVGRYTSDKYGFIYYGDLPTGSYLLEAESVPAGYEFSPTKITKFEYVEEATFTPAGAGTAFQYMGLTLPTGTYVINWESDKYLGFQEFVDSYMYPNGHPHQLVLKMQGNIPWQWGYTGPWQSKVEVGYVAYEVDLDGNDLGVVEGVEASVDKVYNIDGSFNTYRVASNNYGLGSLVYEGKEPENYEYLFTIDKLPEGLTLLNENDKQFSWIPAQGIHGDTLIYYLPVIATSDVQLKVYDQKTGKCLVGAKVQLLDSKGNVITNADGVSEFVTTEADENGYNCLLENLKVGNYQIKVIELPDDGTVDGYAYPANINITSTKNIVNSYEIPVAHNGFVKVNVVDADTGETLTHNNITVNLYKGTDTVPFANLTLDEFGTYYRKGKLLEDTSIRVELCFPTNVYHLTTITQNTVEGNKNLTWDTTGSYQNVLSTVLTRDGFDLTYALTVRTGDIKVLVQDKDTKQPIANTTITIYDESGKEFTTAKTDASGYVSLTKVIPGKYTVKVTETPKNYLPNNESLQLDVVVEQLATGMFELERNNGYVNVSVKELLQNGTLTNFDRMTNLVIKDANGAVVHTYSTDSHGSTTPVLLDAGEYTVAIQDALTGYTIHEATGKTFTITHDETQDVVLTVERDRNNLSVLVVDEETNLPLANNEVAIYDSNNTVVATLTTDKNGKVYLENLPTGTYYAIVTKAVTGYNAPTTKQSIEVTKNSEGTTTIKLKRQKADVTIYVKDLDENIVPGAVVEFGYYDNNGNFVVLTGNDGSGNKTEFNVGATGYITLKDVPTDNYVARIKTTPKHYVTTEYSEKTFAVKENENNVVTLYINKMQVGLVIQVIDAETKEIIPGVVVTIIPTETGLKINKTTDGYGEANFGTVDCDLYGYYASLIPEGYSAPAIEYIDLDDFFFNGDARLMSVAYRTIELTRHKQDLNVTIRDKDTKELIPNAKVEVYDESGNKVAEGRTDENGKTPFDDLPTGNYVVKVTEVPEGYHKPADLPVVVEYEKATNVTIEIEKMKGDLDVTVQDKDTKDPIPNAKVEIYDNDGNKVTEGTTDENGKLVIEDLPIGDYTIKVTEVPDGYEKPDDTTVTVKDEETTKTVIEIREMKGDLDVTVQDKDTKDPIPNAKVEIYDNDGNKVTEGTTDENGKLVIEDLPIGDYTIKVTEVPDGYNKPDDTTVTVKDEETTNVTIEIEKMKGDLDITVQDKDTKDPIPNAKVEIYDNDGNKVTEGTTDENGKLVIEDLPIGDYTIKVTEVPDGYNKPDDTTVTVKDEEKTDVVIEVEKQKGDLDVTVQDKDTKDPIPNAKVEIYDNDGNKVTEGTTDENGKLVIEDLPIGDYTIKVTEVPDGYNKPDDTTITVEDEKTTNVVVEVEKMKGDLDVTVQDKDTKDPIPNAKVEIYDNDGNKVTEGTTDENGRLVIEDLPIGDYTIKVTEVPDGYNKPDDTTVTVKDEEKTDVIIEVEKQKGNLKITVVDKDTQEPLANTLVAIIDKDGNLVTQTKTNGSGEIYLEKILAGTYTIDVIEAPDGYTAPQAEDVVVENNKTTSHVIELSRDKGNLSIVVEDKETKELLPNITVVVKDSNGKVVGEYVTNENGQVIVSNLPTGDYTVETKDLPATYKTPDVQTTTVEKDETSNVVISLTKATGGLTMVAKEKLTSNYLKDVEFEVYNEAGELIGTYTSLEDGSALAEALLVGRYSVKVTKVPEGFKLPANAKEVEIVEDMNTTVIFELERVEENVQTGDNRNIAGYGLLAGLSGAGLLALRKKKKQ